MSDVHYTPVFHSNFVPATKILDLSGFSVWLTAAIFNYHSSKVSQTFRSGVGAHFITKYHQTVSRRLVTESLFLTLGTITLVMACMPRHAIRGNYCMAILTNQIARF